MRKPALIRDNIVSAEKGAETFGIPISRVRTIEKLLQESRRRKASRTRKDALASVAGKKRSASKT